MSYAIIRNEKLTRNNAKGLYIHNNRKSKGHSNKEIDTTKTYLNFYYKKNELTYIKEFDKIKKENNLQGHIRSNSIIMCEMVITSDNEFFNKIGIEETKRYFKESYKFVCNYNNLGEKNIISAVVHLDETTPHMHLIYIPVVKSKDKEENEIEKICARDFWRGRNSYRELQNKFYQYIISKGFKVERGLPIEETKSEHQKISELKKITNFENTKKILNEIKLELPKVPEINDIKLIKLNKTKIEEEIIKPKDKLIKELYRDNLVLHTELSKQSKIVDEAEKYQKEREYIIEDNKELNNKVKKIEKEYEQKSNNLEFDYSNRKDELEKQFKEKEFDIECTFKNKIKKLEKENSHLHKIVEKFYETTKKFIEWVCHKFGIGESKELVKKFEKETNTLIDPDKQIKKEEKENKWDLEM